MSATDLQAKLIFALQTAASDLYVSYVPQNHRGVGCSVDSCPNLAYAKGLCNAHYIRFRQGKPMGQPLQNRGRRISCTECGNPVDSKGGWALCKSHYKQRRRKIIRRVCVEYLGDICSRCKVSYPDYVYDFHHRNALEKEHSPANMIDAVSLAIIAEEVVKCDLLCANCHRIEHHGTERIPEKLGKGTGSRGRVLES